MPPRSDAYTLVVRQGPERAKAFAGPKEKGIFLSDSTRVLSGEDADIPQPASDRKPVDPPPIVQLRIRDPEDPAQ